MSSAPESSSTGSHSSTDELPNSWDGAHLRSVVLRGRDLSSAPVLKGSNYPSSSTPRFCHVPSLQHGPSLRERDPMSDVEFNSTMLAFLEQKHPGFLLLKEAPECTDRSIRRRTLSHSHSNDQQRTLATLQLMFSPSNGLLRLSCVDRTPSHETFSRHFHPCAHITLWLKVSHDVSA